MLVMSAAGGGGKPPGIAAQVTPPEGIKHAWCLSILKSSRLMLVGSKMQLVALTLPALTAHAQSKKSPARSSADVMQSSSSSCSSSKAVAAAFTIVINRKGSLEFAAITASASQGAGRKVAEAR